MGLSFLEGGVVRVGWWKGAEIGWAGDVDVDVDVGL